MTNNIKEQFEATVDYLYNTIQLHYANDDNKRYSIYTVVKAMEELLAEDGLTNEDKLYQDAIVLGYLHEIGHGSLEDMELGFTAVSGYKYLKKYKEHYSINDEILIAVAYQSDAEELYKMLLKEEPNVLSEKAKAVIQQTYYNLSTKHKGNLGKYTKDLIKYITKAKMYTDEKGYRIDPEDKVYDVELKYGSDSVYTKHMKKLKEKYLK